MSINKKGIFDKFEINFWQRKVKQQKKTIKNSNKGASINYVDRIFRIFGPLPLSLTSLLNKLL